MSPQVTAVTLWQAQREFFEWGPTPCLFLGGVGAGKSYIGIMKMLYLLDQYPGSRGAIMRQPYALSCESAGLSDRMVLGLRQKYEHLDTMFRKARAMAAKEMVAKIRDNQDWRAAAWLLERGIAKVEFQEAPQSKDDKLVVEIRINRDDKVALEGGVRMIDVTPEELPDAPMVPGLRALPEAEDLPRGQGAADPLRGSGGGR